MWFDTWSDVWRVVGVGSAGYVALVVILRVSGKRTLSKLNAFDLVVTVAFGSTLATILLSADVSWADGVAAFGVLAALQALVSWTTARAGHGRSVVTAAATVLVRDGVLDEDALRAQRLTHGEIRQALRSGGVGGLDEVGAIVLESDGTLSVVTRGAVGDGWALQEPS